MLSVARSLSATLEREISVTAGTLQALSESKSLDRNDAREFYDEARRVMKTQPNWMTVILLSPDGQQLINAQQPFGVELPSVNDPVSLKRVIETRQPVLGNIALGKQGQKWGFPIRVPVLREGELRYVLTAVITPATLSNLIASQSPAEGEWTRTIVDANGRVAARSRSPEEFIGQPATPSFLEQTSESSEGVFQNTTLDGRAVYVAYMRSSVSGWISSVSVPVEIIDAPAQRAMFLVFGVGLALLFVSGMGAFYLSRRISRDINSVAVAAEVLAKGERPHIKPSSIQEVARLGSSLENSAELLMRQEFERDEHLRQAQEARKEAELASRLKDEFLITLSHELRSPLHSVIGWTAMLRTGALSSEKAHKALESIERNARAQASLIDDLLDMSRIISGKLRLEKQTIDVADVLTAAVDTVRPCAEAKNIELNLQLCEAATLVVGDSNRLQQVLWNLLSNAVKFTPQSGRVEAHLIQINSHVEILVRDTGIGIKPEFIPHAFDRFRQADGSTTREYGGLGLGLAIVRHLTELHGGTVSAASEGEGKGAAFTVKLPLAN